MYFADVLLRTRGFININALSSSTTDLARNEDAQCSSLTQRKKQGKIKKAPYY